MLITQYRATLELKFWKKVVKSIIFEQLFLTQKKVLTLPEVNANYVIKNKDQTVLNESYNVNYIEHKIDSNKGSCKSASFCHNHDQDPLISYCINAAR